MNTAPDVLQKTTGVCITRNTAYQKKPVKYIDFKVVMAYYRNKTENNLLIYLRSVYGNKNVEHVKQLYYIGTDKSKGAVFWSINKNNKVQKAKVCYYKENGKRTSYFKVPYKNEDG